MYRICISGAFCARALVLLIASMASSETAEPVGTITKIQAACEYKALKQCLERNEWKKEKCEKEWQEFENLCSKNRQ